MRKLSQFGPSIVVLVTAGFVLLLGPLVVRQLTYEQTSARIEEASLSLGRNNVLEQLNQAYRDIALIVEPSVVHISTQIVEEDSRGREQILGSSGSGWIYDELGHVVTNFHVIQNADHIEVQLHTGELRTAEFVGADPTTDIALLRIDPQRIHPAQRSEPSERVEQGDLVFAFGSPFDFRFSMSSGVVSGLGRHVGLIRDDNGRWHGYENFIQVDAAINPGNSGGPLTDVRGRVVGMNTAIATRRRESAEQSYFDGQFAGIGLAIPLDMIEPVVRQLIATGIVAKGYLGVEPMDLDAGAAMTLRRLGFLGQGVMIRTTRPDGPAREAGLRPGDLVTAINNRAVNSVAQLRSVISSMLPGDSVRIDVWRYDEGEAEGGAKTFDVQLARLDQLRDTGVLPPDQRNGAIPSLGILKISTSEPSLARELSVGFTPGVIVQRVAPDSSLVEAIPQGSTIIAVGDEPVTSLEQFYDRLEQYNLRDGVLVTVVKPSGEKSREVLRVNVW
jgi:serine protease Do